MQRASQRIGLTPASLNSPQIRSCENACLPTKRECWGLEMFPFQLMASSRRRHPLFNHMSQMNRNRLSRWTGLVAPRMVNFQTPSRDLLRHIRKYCGPLCIHLLQLCNNNFCTEDDLSTLPHYSEATGFPRFDHCGDIIYESASFLLWVCA